MYTDMLSLGIFKPTFVKQRPPENFLEWVLVFAFACTFESVIRLTYV